VITRTAGHSGLRLATVVLPIVTILLFGVLGGLSQLIDWISGIALGCVEAAILVCISRVIERRKSSSSGAPFYIASGVIIGIYAISVILEVILLGYLFSLPAASYALIHLITILGFALALGLIAGAGKYAGTLSQKENDQLVVKRETVDWISSIRKRIQLLQDTELQSLDRQMGELEETLRYSDPISHASLYEVEQIIRQKISLLEDQVTLIGELKTGQRSEQIEQTAHMIRDTLRTVQDRNTTLLKAKTGST